MAQWHYQKNGEIHGPVSGKELKTLAESKQLDPSDLVRKVGTEKWAKAKRVKGLFKPSKSPPLTQAQLNSDEHQDLRQATTTFFTALLAYIKSKVRYIKRLVQDNPQTTAKEIDASSSESPNLDSTRSLGVSTGLAGGLFIGLGCLSFLIVVCFLSLFANLIGVGSQRDINHDSKPETSFSSTSSLSIYEVDEEFEIAASKLSNRKYVVAQKIIEYRNYKKFTFNQLKSTFGHELSKELDTLFDEWKANRKRCGDRRE